MKAESGTDLNELMRLKDIYLVCLDKGPVVSRVSREQREFMEKHGIRLEGS